jgi:drug/metabolite transporter superfamily protein YnfA
MPIGKTFVSKLGIFREFLSFLWQRKLWWMIPMVVFLVLFGILLIFTQSSGIAPFIYSLF